MTVETLRPNAVMDALGWTAQPSGTLPGVTSDDSDPTYAQASSTAAMRLKVPGHVLTAGYGRHQARVRLRGRSTSGTASVRYGPRTQVAGSPVLTTASLTTSVREFTGSWVRHPSLVLENPGTLNLVAAFTPTSSPSLVRVNEVFLDIDTRHVPTFDVAVLDGAGVDHVGGPPISDTNVIGISVIDLNYDGLVPRFWRMAVYKAADVALPGFEPFVTPPYREIEGNGAPPLIPMAVSNGSYEVFVDVASTIRIDDPHIGTLYNVAFQIDAILPAPPTNLTVEVQNEPPEARICWEAPAAPLPWAETTQVHAEVTRTDCIGTQRIGLVPDGLVNCFTDRFIPVVGQGEACDDEDHECRVCYEVRYWGFISEVVTPIDVPVPAGVILAWPGENGAIPSNWSRVTALDGRYPRGAPAGVEPGAVGGAASHVHTSADHDHSLSHAHVGNPATAAGTLDTGLVTGSGSLPQVGHTHSRPNTATNTARSGDNAGAIGAGSNHLSRKDVIFVESNGLPTTIAAGLVGFQHSDAPFPGWEAEDSGGAGTATRPPFLRGAGTGADGGLGLISVTGHSHSHGAHTHPGVAHDHTIGDSGTTGATTTRQLSGSGSANVAHRNHRHALNVLSEDHAALGSASGGTSTVNGVSGDQEPPWRATNFIRSLTGPLFSGLIGMWLGELDTIPVGWKLCDGTDGTPDFRGRFVRHRGGLSVNQIGGGAAHAHSFTAHDHPTSGHQHMIDAGAASAVQDWEPGGMQVASGGDHHASSLSDPTTPTVGNTQPPNLVGAEYDPPFTDVAYIQLVSTSTETLDDPILVVTEASSFCVDAPPAPAEGCDWISGATGGDLCICPQRAWTRTRPFGVFQPAQGGVPQVITGTEGLRDYTLTIPVKGDDDFEMLEMILAQPMVYYRPAGLAGAAANQWMAPQAQSSWDDPPVKGVRQVTAGFVGVLPQPVGEPVDVVPMPTRIAE